MWGRDYIKIADRGSSSRRVYRLATRVLSAETEKKSNRVRNCSAARRHQLQVIAIQEETRRDTVRPYTSMPFGEKMKIRRCRRGRKRCGAFQTVSLPLLLCFLWIYSANSVRRTMMKNGIEVACSSDPYCDAQPFIDCCPQGPDAWRRRFRFQQTSIDQNDPRKNQFKPPVAKKEHRNVEMRGNSHTHMMDRTTRFLSTNSKRVGT